MSLAFYGCDSGSTDIPESDDVIGSTIAAITHFTEEDGLAGDLAFVTATCPNGDVWFGYGVNGSGITRFDGNTWQTLTTDDGLPINSVYALACDRRNNVWIGYGINAGGLTRYDGISWTTFTEEDGLTSERVEAVAIGPDGALWLTFGNQGRGVDKVTLQ